MKKVALGIDIGGMSIKSAFIDEKGEMTGKFVVPVVRGEKAEETLDRFILAAKKALSEVDPNTQVVGIGIGCPGGINTFQGTCDYSNNLGWKDVPVAQILEKALGLPAKIDNDANAAMLGEIRFGAAKRFHNAILITIGTGIGGGLYLDDHLYVGNEGKGAELGHMVIQMDGEPCSCGRKGCFEAYASASALMRLTRKAMEDHPDSKMWSLCDSLSSVGGSVPFDAAEMGDEAAQGVLKDYIHGLGEGILNLINIFRPEAILLSGGVSRQGERLRKPLLKYLKDWGYGFGTDKAPKVEILISQLGADMGIYGAAALGFEIAR